MTTNIAALLAYPGFYHLHQVVVVGKLERRGLGELRLVDESGSVRVVFKGSEPDELAEVRGEFWDLGRMSADDPRLAKLRPSRRPSRSIRRADGRKPVRSPC